MTHRPLTPLDRQIQRARRQLFLRVFIIRLTWCMTGALVLAAICILLQALLLPRLLGELTGLAAYRNRRRGNSGCCTAGPRIGLSCRPFQASCRVDAG